jgi:hypothetical protein
VVNDLVFDVLEGGGAFAAELVDAIENARLDGVAGLGARALDGRQGGLRRVEDNAAEAALDLAEQPVLDGVPLGGVRRVRVAKRSQ